MDHVPVAVLRLEVIAELGEGSVDGVALLLLGLGLFLVDLGVGGRTEGLLLDDPEGTEVDLDVVGGLGLGGAEVDLEVFVLGISWLPTASAATSRTRSRACPTTAIMMRTRNQHGGEHRHGLGPGGPHDLLQFTGGLLQVRGVLRLVGVFLVLEGVGLLARRVALLDRGLRRLADDGRRLGLLLVGEVLLEFGDGLVDLIGLAGIGLRPGSTISSGASGVARGSVNALRLGVVRLVAHAVPFAPQTKCLRPKGPVGRRGNRPAT